jgi:hypothetical protein
VRPNFPEADLPGIVYGCLVTHRQPAGSADEAWSTPQGDAFQSRIADKDLKDALGSFDYEWLKRTALSERAPIGEQELQGTFWARLTADGKTGAMESGLN